MLAPQTARPAPTSCPDSAPVAGQKKRARGRQAETPDERKARIERLRIQLQNGTYIADATQIADALLASGDLEP